MIDTAERAIEEAESWLVSAKDKLVLAESEDSAVNVCCALSIHAIIRANDALTLKFMKVKGTRHDDAPALFSKMLQQGKLSSENARFLRIIQKAMTDKSGADYGKKIFSHDDATRYVQDAEEFVSSVKCLVC